MKFIVARIGRRGGRDGSGAQARRRRAVRMAVLPLVVTAGLVVAACGNSGAQAAGSSDVSKLSADQLLAQAKKEGSVTFYTEFTESNLKGMIDAFEKDYPGIKLNTLTLNVDDLVARVTTEQRGGQYSADVVTEDGLHMGQLIDADAVSPYEPSTNPTLPANLKLPQGFASVAFVTTNVIAYNPEVLAAKHITPPTSFEDLTKPEWRGNFSMAPNGADLLQALNVSMGGDQALDLLKRLGANNPRLVASHSQAVAQVQAGEPAATISYGSYSATAKKATPGTLDFVNPSPLPTNAFLLGLGKNAPHPAAARLFMDWFEGTGGQNAIVQALGFSSLREDANNDKSIWDPSMFPPVFTPVQTLDEYNAVLKAYKAAIKAP